MSDSWTRQTPLSPTRATLVSLGILAAVLLLALAYVSERKWIRLHEPVRHSDWRMRFQVPSDWREEGLTDPLRARMRVFRDARGERCLRLRRLDVSPETTPETVCRTILAQYVVLAGVGSLGDWPGTAVDWSAAAPAGGGVFHLFLLSAVAGAGSASAEAYTIELQSSYPPGARDRAIWRAVIDSLETAGEGTATVELVQPAGG